MKRALFLLCISVVLLTACGNATEVKPVENEEVEKLTEMLPSGVNSYLNQMTGKYSSAYTVAVTKEDKMKYLNEAITDIKLAVTEIEDKYEKGTSPTDELLELAETLLTTIDNEMIGDSESAYDDAYDAGIIIGDLSREYLDGELPVGIKMMIEKENVDD